MCGRTCLTLDPNQILCACKYKATTTKTTPSNDKAEDLLDLKKEDGQERHSIKSEQKETEEKGLMPEWRAEYNCGRQYLPSYNMAPTDITPVLVAGAHFSDNDASAKDTPPPARILMPMMWGMIPFWHKGDYRKHGLTTNNCRLEHMLDSKLYRGPFRRGQRCVVLCEGFYEWQTTQSAKPSERAAHLLYMPQSAGVEIHDKATWPEQQSVELLRMAGLFDVWTDENGDKMYSYAVITFESSKIMSWLHHRMPAILETEQQVNDWLDYKRVSDEQALSTLRPATTLKWHRVSQLVNNSRNKSEQCNKPIELTQSQKPITPANKTMLAWLGVRKRREALSTSGDDEDEDECPSSAGGVGGLSATTSESDAEHAAQQRPRFRDFKRAKKQMKMDVFMEKPQASSKLNDIKKP